LNFADHVDARAACKTGDALACATAGLAYGDNIALRLEWAERACALGVATRGGCIEITLLAPTLNAKVAAVQRACDAGSPPACSLVASMLAGEDSATLSAAQQTQAARALQRCCELAPGADCCNALTPAELPE
jgi:TPR repeat protein